MDLEVAESFNCQFVVVQFFLNLHSSGLVLLGDLIYACVSLRNGPFVMQKVILTFLKN